MAEGMLKHSLPNHSIRSAGLGALIGNPADPSSILLMNEAGIDITDHRAQQISSDLVMCAELILVMDTEQKKYIESKYMAARGKVFRLCEGVNKDVPDPYRESLESFRSVFHLVQEGAQFWADRISRMS